MPTYEYECKNCKKIFEIFHSITASPLKTCPKCKGTIKRLISMGGGIIFKGKGFYATDYRKSSSTNKTTGKDCSTCAPKSNCQTHK